MGADLIPEPVVLAVERERANGAAGVLEPPWQRRRLVDLGARGRLQDLDRDIELLHRQLATLAAEPAPSRGQASYVCDRARAT